MWRVTQQPGKLPSSILKDSTQETGELRMGLSPMKETERQEEKQNLPSCAWSSPEESGESMNCPP